MAEPESKDYDEEEKRFLELNELWVESLIARFGERPSMSLSELEADMKEYAPELYQLEFCNNQQ